MKVSKYIHLFTDNSRYYVVQTVNKRIFQIEGELYRAFADKDVDTILQHKDKIKFVEANLLVDNSTNETEELEAVCIKEDNDDEWNSLHIIPSLKCNLQCAYCFVLRDTIKGIATNELDDDTLYSMIDMFVENNPSRKKAMTFYGGEPFVNRDIVFKAVNYANSKYKDMFQYKIVTNGTLITEEIADFLSRNAFDVNLSIDGNKKAHDCFRLYKNGTSTYEDVIEGYKNLKKAGNSIKILVTVGEHNIDYLRDCVLDLIKLQPTSIALNLPKKLQTSDNQIDVTDFDYVCQRYFECLELCYQNRIPEAHFADIIYGFLSKEIHYRPCSGCGKQIALSPYGKIGPCQAYVGTGKYFVDIDKVSNKDDLRKTEEFKKWKNITMFSSLKCRDCYLLPICAGDCPYDWENREGSFDNPPDGYCMTRKKMFDYLLNRIVNKKNILFKGNNQNV